MKGSINLGKIPGIPLWLQYSWFLVLFLVISSLAVFLGELRPFWYSVECWSVALVASTLLFVSVAVHELSHSLVARRNGISVNGITLFILRRVTHMSREAASPHGAFHSAGRTSVQHTVGASFPWLGLRGGILQYPPGSDNELVVLDECNAGNIQSDPGLSFRWRTGIQCLGVDRVRQLH